MAIAPYFVEPSGGSGEGPPCALKIGPINCFCMWDAPQSDVTETWSRRDGSLRVPIAIEEGLPAQPRLGEGGGRSCGSSRLTSAYEGASRGLARDSSGMTGEAQIKRRAGAGGEHPLLSLVRLHAGASPAVDRELAAIAQHQHSMEWLEDGDIERLRRLIAQHPCCISTAWNWLLQESSEQSGIQFGARVEQGLCFYYRFLDFQGCSPVKGLAALLEVDLMTTFNEEVMSAEPLGAHTARRDAIWRVASQDSGRSKRAEKVWSYSALDALDEPIGSVLVFAHSLQESSPPSDGQLAEQKARASLLECECAIYCVKPLWSESGGGYDRAAPVGFRLMESGISRNASLALALGELDRTINPVVSIMARHQRFRALLSEYIQSGRQLEQRMRTSPRTELYDRVSRHFKAPVQQVLSSSGKPEISGSGGPPTNFNIGV